MHKKNRLFENETTGKVKLRLESSLYDLPTGRATEKIVKEENN